MGALDLARIRRYAKEGSWVAIGHIVAALGSLAFIRVLTEYLEPHQYGQLALGLTVAALGNQMVVGGVLAGVGRFYSIAAEVGDLRGYLCASFRLMRNSTAATTAIGLVLLAGLHWFGYSQWMAFATATLVFSVLAGYNLLLRNIQNAARQRAIVASHIALDAWLKIFLVVGMMLWLGRSSTVVIIGCALSFLLVIASQFWFLQRTLLAQKAPPRGPKNWSGQIWTYSWPFSVWGVFTWAQQSSDRWALEIFSSTHDVGNYAVLMNLGYTPIIAIVAVATSFLDPVLFQRAGDITDTSRKAHVHRLIWVFAFLALLFTVTAFLVAMNLHEWIFRLLVAREYRVVSYLMPWMVLAAGLFAAGQMLSLKLMIDVRSGQLLTPKIVTALAGVSLSVVGAAEGGLHGVVAAVVGFSALYFLWMLLLARSVDQRHPINNQ